jgi:hypothetical protein
MVSNPNPIIEATEGCDHHAANPNLSGDCVFPLHHLIRIQRVDHLMKAQEEEKRLKA